MSDSHKGKTMMHQTTEDVYAFIQSYFEKHHYAPSYREIAEGCYLAMGSLVRHLDRLEAWGWIQREPGRARSIWLTRTKDKN